MQVELLSASSLARYDSCLEAQERALNGLELTAYTLSSSWDTVGSDWFFVYTAVV